jgi:hypothetical protein
MNFVQEYALLIAVALPVVAIVGLNVFLAMTGESTTLLLPGRMSFPSIPLEPAAVAEPATQSVESSNDPLEKLAA